MIRRPRRRRYKLSPARHLWRPPSRSQTSHHDAYPAQSAGLHCFARLRAQRGYAFPRLSGARTLPAMPQRMSSVTM
jgi:hypothetical protein